jgi:hypothetical protein
LVFTSALQSQGRYAVGILCKQQQVLKNSLVAKILTKIHFCIILVQYRQASVHFNLLARPLAAISQCCAYIWCDGDF